MRHDPFFEFQYITETGHVRFQAGGYTSAERRELFRLWKQSNPEIVAQARKIKEEVMLTFNMMDAKVVVAVFPTTPDKEYAYFVPEGDEPEVGDVILTSTSWDTFAPAHKVPWDTPIKLFGADTTTAYTTTALDGKLARVIDVTAAGHPKASRFYMKLISVRELAATQELNQSMAQRAKKVREAHAQLDKMLESESRVELYRRLAEKNPEAKKLIALIEGKE